MDGVNFDQRVARLRRELTDELGIELPNLVLEELAHAKYMDAHEGRRPTYGAVIWAESRRATGGLGTRALSPSAAGYSFRHEQVSLLRKFADGRTSFLVHTPGNPPAIVVDPSWGGSETALASYAHDTGVTIVQRVADGRVRLYANDHIYVENQGLWLSRSTAIRFRSRLAELLLPADSETCNAILNLCVHVLSPAGNGATLIWFPEGVPYLDPDPNLDRSVEVIVPRLSAANPDHAATVSHVLGQMDRAVILDGLGDLVAMNISLAHDDWFTDVAFDGGTRHTSAWRYSASQPLAVVFVVSADGPVTVLHRGQFVRSSG